MTKFNIDERILRPVWFEIDLDALRHKYREARRLGGEEVNIICALKCNAYGFGYGEAAEEVLSLGAYGVAVADLFEAVNLRQQGIKAPILLYANNLPSSSDTVIEFNLIPTVTSLDSARAYSKRAAFPLSVFVKIDVGLDRIGVLPELAVPFIEEVVSFKNIVLAGIYTHFHFSEDNDYMDWQFSRFKVILEELEGKGIDIPIKMASATPSIVQFPHMCLNTVDPGRLIFGNPVVSSPRQHLDIRPVFRALKTRLIDIKTIGPRSQFAQKRSFPVTRDMILGVIPCGWGDGYSIKHGSIGMVLVRGKRIPILGDVQFEHTRLDLTPVPEAKVGDEVVLIGRQGNEEISLAEVAEIRSTDLHDICQSVRHHVPRLYIKDGRPFKLKTPLGTTIFN